ncbi:Uncharacterised protein [Serratia odorifera]|uniref:Uncharacterized protein n=1 Tax=Serratia odorifera TaxID=618 RepID=A0A3S4HRS7_SEROD|nr:Uncharacterised protein [Serratia odorifera]
MGALYILVLSPKSTILLLIYTRESRFKSNL